MRIFCEHRDYSHLFRRSQQGEAEEKKGENSQEEDPRRPMQLHLQRVVCRKKDDGELYELFQELNQFRRLRMDGALLTVMPAFIKQAGLTLPQNMRAIRPGGFITLPNLNGIKPLFDHTLPPEAYREPAEIKAEIDDATGISG